MWCGLYALLANIDIRGGTHKFDIIKPVVNRRVFFIKSHAVCLPVFHIKYV